MGPKIRISEVLILEDFQICEFPSSYTSPDRNIKRTSNKHLRRVFFSILSWIFLFAISSASFGQTSYFSKSSGNLELLSTWGQNSDGSGTEPINFTANDQVFNIRNNPTPTIGANWTVSGTNSMIIVGDGSNPATLTIPGALVLTGPTEIENNGTLRITSTSATPYSGVLTVDNGGTYEHARDGGTIPTATWNISSNCNITGLTATAPGGLGQTFGNFNYNSAYNLTLPASGLTIQGSLNISAGSILANTRNINLTGNLTGTNNLTYTTGTLSIGGNFSNSGTFTCGTGIVNYNGTAAQQVKATTYNTLNISGSGTKTLQGNITVNGNLAITGGTLNLGTTATVISVTGTTTINSATGGIDFGTVTSKTFTANGILALTAGTLEMSGAAGNILDLKGNANTGGGSLGACTNNPEIRYSAAGAQNVIALNYCSLTLSGSGIKTLLGATGVGNNLAISGTATLYTNANQVTGNATGTFTMGAGTTLNLGNTGTATVVLFPTNFTAANITLDPTSTVNYQANISQVVSNVPSYGNLTISTNGTTKTCDGDLTVSGNLAINGTSVFSAGTTGSVWNLTGNATIDGTLDFGTDAVKTISISGDLINASGTITMQGDGLAHILNLSGTNNAISAFNTTAASGSIVNYNLSGDQTIFISNNYRNLNISGSGIKSLGNNTNTVNDNLDVTGATLAFYAGGTARPLNVIGNLSGTGTIDMSTGPSAHVLNLGGSTNNIGTLTTNSTSNSQVNYTRVGDQNVFGSPNYRNLSFSGGGNKSLQSNVTVNNALTLTAGLVLLGNNDLTVGNGATSSAGSVTAMVITDGTGQMKKIFPAGPSAFIFPVGDNTVSNDYSPSTINYTANSSIRTIGVVVIDSQHPSDGTSTDYLSRYWTFTDNQAGTYTYDITLRYSTLAPSDLTGLHANLRVNRWNGSLWTQYTTGGGSPAITATAINETIAPLNNTSFTGRVNVPVYTWNQTGVPADFQVASNWTPSRLSPQPTDILQFDNNGTTTATNVPTQTIGNLVISNGSNVTLEAGAAATLTVGNVAGTDLTVNTGTTLSLGTNVNLTIPGSATSTIDGTLNIGSTSTLTTSAALAVTTVTGTGIVNNTGTITGSATGLIFNSGSNYNHTRDGGTVPTAGWNAASNCNITGLTAAAPGGLGQTFGNLNYNSAFTLILTNTLTIAGNLDISGGSIDANTRTIALTGNLTGTNDLAFTTAGILNIGGNYSNTGLFTPGTGSIVNYNGSAQNVKSTTYYSLTLSGSGDKTMLGDVTVGRTATFTAGSLVLNGNVLNLNYNTTITAGTITGSNSSDIVITGTPAVTLPPVTGGLQNLTIDKTSNGVTLTSNLDISGAANFTAGPLALNGRTLDLQGTTTVGTGTIAGSAASNLIVSSSDNSGLVLPNITGGLLDFTVNKTGTLNTVTLGGPLTTGGALSLSNGELILNSFLLTINGSLSQTSGTITGGGNSDIAVGTLAAAAISLPAVTNGLRNLTISRTAGIALGGDNTLTGTLTLTTGAITLGTYNLTLAGTAAVASVGGTDFIIADGTGQLKKVFAAGATGAYVLPVGDASGDYSPVSLQFTANSIQRTVGVRVTDAIHPNDGGSSDNISRYWTFTDDLAGGTYTYNASFTYITPADLTGAHANLRVNRWDGSAWTQYTTTGVSPAITVTGVTETTSPFNNSDFTGRNQGPVTYNWNQTGLNASWADPASWTPARLSPQPTDILIFDNNGITTATNVPSQTIGQLVVSNGTNISLQSAAAAQTLTISGGTGIDLHVQAGTTLQLSSAGANQIGIAFNPATPDASIEGTLVINPNAALSNSYTATNSNTIVTGSLTNSGGIITSTAANLSLNAGSFYNHNRNTGTIPTATWNTTSTCSIGTGFTGTAPGGLTQTFGNFTMDAASFTLTLGGTLTVTNDLNINNGTIAAGGNTINLARHLTGGGDLTFGGAGTLNIGGDNTNTGTFTCSTSTVNYNGAAQKVKGTTYNNLIISGSDTKTLQGAATVNTLLTLTAGILQLGDYDLTLASATAVQIAGSPFDDTKMIETNGTGYLIQSSVSITNQSFNNKLYPVGSGGYYNPFIITGLPNSIAGARSLAIRAVPVNPLILSNSINKYWDIIATGITTGAQVLSFQYNAGEVVGDALLFQPYTNASGSWNIATGPSVPGSNPATSTGSAIITGLWTVGSSSTYYSYQTGNWTDVNTWTFDPGGTTGPGTTIPGDNDKVVILSGRTVSLSADIFTNNLDITINNGGFLDLGSFLFNNSLKALRGDGVLKLSTSAFPTAITNTFVSTDGGTTEYNVDGEMSLTQALYYHLTINSPGTVVLTSDITLNGNLNVKQGVFQINNTVARRLKLIINGDVTVDNSGSITIGTGGTRSNPGPIPSITGNTGSFLNYYELNSHRIQIYGNFINNGVARFSNLAYPIYNSFPANGFATVYFNGSADRSLTCNGQTDFYNLVVDKGTGQTFKLTVQSSAYNNFRLFGANTSDGSSNNPGAPMATSTNPNLKKALWIKNGTLVLQGLVVIPSLTEGATAGAYPSDFFIPANGALILDGVGVIVLATADSFTEVNAAYGLAGGSNALYGINATGGYSGISNMGKLQVNNGYLSTRESSGLNYVNYASGEYILNGGTVDTKQFHHNPDCGATGLVSYVQSGGNMIIRGRFTNNISYTVPADLANATINTARIANGIDVASAIGSLSIINNPANGFTMSGGTISVYDVCNAGTPALAVLIDCPVPNINVTGGTVNLIPTTGTLLADADYHVNSRGSFYNFNINRASGTSAVQLNTNPLVVLNNLSLTSGTLTSNNLNVTVGGNLAIAGGTTYNPGTNTTILSGSSAQTFTVDLGAPLSLNNLTVDKPAGIVLNFAGSQSVINVGGNLRLVAGTMDDSGKTINVAGNVFNSGVHSGTGKVVLNGAATTQTIDGNGTFTNLEINNTNTASAPVSLLANVTINGTLTLSQDKVFNLSLYNLKINSSGTISGFNSSRYFTTAGNLGDGGITKVYSSATSFTFPIGVNNYTPATLGINGSPTAYGSITVVPIDFEHPNVTVPGRSLSYFWRVRSSGLTLGPATLTHGYTYADADIVTGTGITEDEYVAARFDYIASTWSNGNANDVDETTNIIGEPGLGNFLESSSFIDGDYTAGDNNPTSPFGTPSIYYSRQSGLWSNVNTWSLTDHTGGVAGTIPGASDIVKIGGQDSVYLATSFVTANTDVRSCASLQIEAGSVLDIGNNPGCNFVILQSYSAGGNNGKIKLSATNPGSGNPFVIPFPSGDFSDFNNNGGTTHYYTGCNCYAQFYLSPTVTSYGNVIFSPLVTDNIIFPNTDVTIQGNLTNLGTTRDSWLCPSWYDGPAYPGATMGWHSPGVYITIEKTVHIKGDFLLNGGTFFYTSDNNLPQHVIVDGDMRIAQNAALDVQYGGNYFGNTTQLNTLTIGGNLINNSDSVRFNYSNGAKICDVTFTGSTNTTISSTLGTAKIRFHNLTLNKGTSQVPTLTINFTGRLYYQSPNDNWLFLQNGTLVYNRTGNLPISTTSTFTIAPTAGLTVNTPSNVYLGNSNSDANDLILNGKLTVLNGNVYVGPVTSTNWNNDIEYSVGGASSIDVQGGNLYVNGQIRRNSSSTGGILKYSQTGGTVTVRGQKQNGTNAKLEVVNTGSIFNMSAGTLTIMRGNGATITPSSPFGDLYLRPETGSVTGGKIVFSQVGMAPAPVTPQNYFLDSNIPLDTLVITGASVANYAKVRLLFSPLTVNGDLTINANSVLDANSINTTVNGNFINTPGINGYEPGTNLTTFSVSNSSSYAGAQSITGITKFYDLTVNPGTSLTLNNPATVNRNLTISSGTFSLGVNPVTVLGNVVNQSSYTDNNGAGQGILLNGTTQQHIAGTGAFARLTLNNASGAVIDNNIDLQEDLTMTLGILDIKTYLLTMYTGSNLQGAPFSATKMITSDGVFSNVGLRKYFNPGATTFLYPIGTNGKYTPAFLTTTANSSVGYLRINNISSRHPAVLDAANSLNYYWEIQSSGISGYDGTIKLKYLQSDVVGDEPNYMAARTVVPGSSWIVAPGVDFTNDTITFTHTGSNNLSGEYTAGIASAFYASTPVFTSIANGYWDDPAIWTQTGGDILPLGCPAGGPNGFIVSVNHVVTIRTHNCSAYRTTINKELRIGEPFFGHNLGTVYGSGILHLERGTFPAGVFTSFLSCASGGTVDYGGIGTYTIIADLYDNIPNLMFTGTGTRVLPNKDLTICDTLTINGPVVDNSVYNKKLTIQGGMKHLSGSLNAGTGAGAIVSFSGTALQTIGGTKMGNFTGASAFNHFEINNAAGLRINDNGAIEVKGNLMLTNGLINTGSSRTLTITNSAINCVVPSGGSVTSFVDGPLTKNISQYDNFLFPVGINKSGTYVLGNKLNISSTQAGPALWTAQYNNPNPTSTTFTSPILGVSAMEYFTITSAAGSKSKVNINWTPTSDVNPLITGGVSNIRIANYSAGSWLEVPSTASGDNNNGTASSSGLVTYTGSDDYTLGSLTTLIPRAAFNPPGPVCGNSGIPVTFTAPSAIPFNYTLNYTRNDTIQPPITIIPAMVPYTLPTPVAGTYKLTGFMYNSGANTGVVNATPVTTYGTPTTSNAGPDQVNCGVSTTFLAGNTPTAGSGFWTKVTGSGETILSPSNPLSQFIGLNGNVYTLRWTISSGTCKSVDDVVINFTILPDPPAAASPQNFCGGPRTIANLVATAPVGCTVDWYSLAVGGVLLPPATVLVTGTTYYAESNGGCVSLTRTPVAVTIYSVPVPTLNGPNLVCLNSTGNVYVTDVGKSNYVWVVTGGFISSGGTSTDNTATVTWNSAGARTISVNYTDAGGCTAGTPTVYNVTVNDEPTITLGTNPSVCSGITTANLTYTATTGSPNRYSVDYSVAAEDEGFVDIPNTTVLPASPISLFVPGAAAPGTYTGDLTVRNFGTGCISGTYPISITIYALPAAPTVGTITQPTCALPTGSVVLSGLPAGNWIINPGAIAGNTASTTISGLASGTYNYTVTSVATGCISPPSANIVINAATPPAAPTTSSVTQPTCAVPSGTIVFNAQAGVQYSVDGITYQAGTTFAVLAPGTYTLYVRSIADNTCITTGAATVTINAIPTPPAAPTTSSVTQPTCAVPSGTIVFNAQAGVQYSVDGITYQAGTTFAVLAPGTYTLYVRSIADNTCITTGAATVTINAIPTPPAAPTTSSVTQPTCAVPSGTIVFNAQAGVQYSVDGITYQAGTTFAVLAPGTYTLYVRSIADNTCITTGAATVTINAIPTPPAAPTTSSVTQPTCAVPSGTIVFNAQAGVQYSVDGITYQAGTTFAVLAPGTYTLYVRSIADNTCITTGAATVTINAIPTPPAAPTTSSVTQPTCAVPSGTIVFNAQAGVQYSVDGITYQAGTTFAVLVPGTYTLYVRSIADNTCITTGAATVTINAIPTPPAAPTTSSVTQPTCAVPSGTIVFNAQAGVQYSVDGITYQAGTTFAVLAPGTYTLYVRSIADNTCITTGAATVTINAIPTPPAAPTTSSVTQPTCAVPSGTIVFNAQAGVQYSVDGITYQAGTTFAVLAPGTYTLYVRSIADNTCITTGAATVTINAIPTPPAAPTTSSVTQPTCAVPSGTIVFNAQAGVQYSVDGITYQAGTTFAVLAPGTYTLYVRSIADNTCITTGAATVTINAIPTPPAAPTTSSVTQPTCAVPSGTIVFNAQAGVQYSVDGITYQAGTTFAVLAPGTYTLYVRSIADNTCITTGAATVTINAIPTPPAAPTTSSVTQPTCAVPSGTIVFNAQAGVQYSVDGITYQAGTTFAVLVPGTYTLYVRSIADNTCITTGAATVTINAIPTPPAAPTTSSVTQPTCAVPSGTIVFNAQAGVQYSVDGITYQAGTTFAVLAPGTYTLYVRSIADNTCITTGAATVTINAIPTPPAAPTTSSVTQPTCAVPSGTIVFNAQAGVQYSVDGITYQAGTTFAVLAPGTYTLYVRSIADNTCITTGAATVTINTIPTPPAAPTTSSVTQPTCAVPSGTIVFNAQAGVQYSVDGITYQAGTTFAVLAPGTYTLYVRSIADNTCITTGAATVTINAIPTPPAAPTTSSVTQPTCAVPTGTIVFTVQAGVEYNVGFGYQASETFTGLAPATYTLTVRSIADNTCITAAASTVTLTAATPPAVPTTSSVTQPTCAVPTGTIVFTVQAGVEYSVGFGYQASETFAGLAPATYTLTVRSITDNTCITAAASTVTLTAAVTIGATAGNNGPVCEGTPLSLTGGPNGMDSYSWTGPDGFTSLQQNPTVSATATPSMAGIYNLTVTLGACSELTSTTVTVTPVNTIVLISAPGTDDQTVCLGDVLANITYSTTGATGANFTGLPAGMTVSWAANTILISGTPTSVGAYTYVIDLTGGCGTVSKTGKITVKAPNSLTLSSALGTDAQTVCNNTAIIDITYNTVSAASATISGLPLGVTGNWASDVFTISGTPTAPGTFNYLITTVGGCGVATASGSIIVNPVLPVSVAIAADVNPICAGATVTFTATPTNGGVTPSYQWYNGATAVGTNSATYAYVPTNGDIITVVLTSSETCQSGGPATSNAVTMTVNPILPVSVTIAADVNPICAGSTVTFTATPVNGGAAPSYQWYNGATAVGANSPTYAYVPTNGDAITVILTSSETCQSGGPATSAPVAMLVNPLLPVSVTMVADANPVCAGTTVTFTATPTNGGLTPTYQWYNGATAVGVNSPTYAYVPTNGDVITVVMTSSETCTSGNPATSTGVTMTVNPVLPVSVTIAADVNPICAGATVTFTATPTNEGVTPSYQWYNGTTAVGTNSATYAYVPTNGDIITVVLTSSETCVSGNPATSAGVTMTVNPILPVSVTIAADVNPICAGSTVTFTATPVNGGATPSYQWYNGATAVGANSPTYAYVPTNGDAITVVLTSSETCQSGGPATSAPVAMLVNPLLPVSVTMVADANPVCAGTTVTFTATPTNGGLTPTYQWYNGATAVGVNSPTYAYVPTNGDVITVVMTSSETCTSGNPATSAGVTMTVNPVLPVSVTIAADVNPICAGATVTFTATPTNGGVTPSYQWYNGATAVGTNSATYAYVPTNGDIITVVLTSSETCQSGGPATSNAVTMTVNPILPVSVTIAADVNPICAGSTVTFTATPVNGGAAPAYQWYNGATAVGANSPTYAYVPTNGDAITVVLTSSETCQSGGPATSGPVTMIVNSTAPAGVTIVADANPVCNGTSVNFTATPVNGGTTPAYQWQVNGVNTGSNSNTFSYSPVNNDGVTVILTSSETCATGNPVTSTTLTMTVNPVLPVTVSIVSDANPVCDGTTVNFTATPTNGGATPSYQWYNGATAVGTNSATYAYIPSNGDIITVVLTSSEICTSGNPATSAGVTMTVNPVLPVSVTIAADVNPICAGSTVTFTATPINGGATPSYQWYNGATAVGVNSPTYAYVPANGDAITVVLTSSETCQSGGPATSAAVIMTVNPLPSGTTVPVDAACFGESTGAVDLTITGGTLPCTFLWSNGATTEDLTGVPAGTYTVTITDANLCSAIVSGTVSQPLSALTATTTKSDVTTIGGNDGSITATGAGGTAPYLYSLNGGAYQASGTFNTLIAGIYTVTVQDMNLCTFPETVTITQPYLPLTGSAITTPVLCFGGSTGSVTVAGAEGVPPYEYSLNGGTWQSSGTFGTLTAGPYTITIRDAAANTFDVLIIIAQPAAALTVATSQDNVTCNGDADGMAVALTTGGTAAYSYSWNTTPAQVNDTITNLTPGTYTVTVTDANSCIISADVTITEPAVLSIDAVPTSSTCPDSDDGQIALEITGGTPAYSVLWADGDTVLTKRDLSPDTYSVVVTDANGCAESASALIDYIGTFNCVVIPQILTPDPADGHNDEWIIRNIDIYPKAEIKVYSRWGKLIYHSKNPSAEPWKGRYYNGKLVPTDSYYYILDLHDGSSIRSGVISVIR